MEKKKNSAPARQEPSLPGMTDGMPEKTLWYGLSFLTKLH